MKKFLAAFIGFGFLSSALAVVEPQVDYGDDHPEEWVQVLSTVITSESPSYQDMYINEPGTYTKARVQVSTHAFIDRFDTISTVLWAKAIPELAGEYQPGVERSASFAPRKVRALRIYARSRGGHPVPIKVWMRKAN